jgi:cell division protein FtsL
VKGSEQLQALLKGGSFMSSADDAERQASDLPSTADEAALENTAADDTAVENASAEITAAEKTANREHEHTQDFFESALQQVISGTENHQAVSVAAHQQPERPVFGDTQTPQPVPQMAKSRIAAKLAIILLIVALAAVAGLNVYQHLSHQLTSYVLEQQIDRLDSETARLSRQVSARESDILELERQIVDKNFELLELDQQIVTLSGMLDAARDLAAMYAGNNRRFQTIRGFLARADAGYASENFRSNTSIMIVDIDDTSSFLTITADLGEDTIVYLSALGSPTVDFQWVGHWVDTTIGVRITPLSVGATYLTFSNNKTWQTFQVLILVVD